MKRRRTLKVAAAALLAATVLNFAPPAGGKVAPGQRRARPKAAAAARLPRVGTIKDYPATGLMTGCGNSYFILPHRAGAPGEDYVFLVRADGDDAWMNLDGRDTRLTLLRTRERRAARGPARWRSEYRAGATRITVLTQLTDREEYPMALSIILRKGRARRVVRAIGYADC